MNRLESSRPVEKVKLALGGQPGKKGPTGSADVCENFRQARSAIGRITTDLEQLRKHAASLVKGTARVAK